MRKDRGKQRAESDWRRLAEKFKEEGEKKVEEATKALEEALENFKLAARCLEQAMKSQDSGLNEKWRRKQ